MDKWYSVIDKLMVKEMHSSWIASYPQPAHILYHSLPTTPWTYHLPTLTTLLLLMLKTLFSLYFSEKTWLYHSPNYNPRGLGNGFWAHFSCRKSTDKCNQILIIPFSWGVRISVSWLWQSVDIPPRFNSSRSSNNYSNYQSFLTVTCIPLKEH